MGILTDIKELKYKLVDNINLGKTTLIDLFEENKAEIISSFIKNSYDIPKGEIHLKSLEDNSFVTVRVEIYDRKSCFAVAMFNFSGCHYKLSRTSPLTVETK